MITQHFPALHIVVLFLTALLLPVICYKRTQPAFFISLLASLFSVVSSVLMLQKVLATSQSFIYKLGGWSPSVGISFLTDHLSIFVGLFVNIIAFFALVYSYKNIKNDFPHKAVSFYICALLAVAGFNGMIFTGDFFNLYVFLEISSLALYGLFSVGEKAAAFSAFRYLIQGAIAGSFYLLGVGFLYMLTGSLNMHDVQLFIQQLPTTSPTLLVAIIFMFTGLAIKTGLFPLHTWLPDAYTFSSSATSALIAPLGTKVGAYVIFRILFFVFGVSFFQKYFLVLPVFSWLAVAGILYGSYMAIRQTELKRLLAYSSVAQIGYIILGFSLANTAGIIGGLLHMMNHALMKAVLFFVAGQFREELGHSDINLLNKETKKRMPFTSAIFVLGAISMIGLPPTVGFFSKWYLVVATAQKQNWIFMAVILLSSLLNAIYFFGVIEKMYFQKVKNPTPTSSIQKQFSFSHFFPLAVLGTSLIIVGLFHFWIVKEILQPLCVRLGFSFF